MKFSEIRAQETSMDKDQLSYGATGWHESVLRSYHIVQKIKELLQRNTPADVILEIIEDLESAKTTAGYDATREAMSHAVKINREIEESDAAIQG